MAYPFLFFRPHPRSSALKPRIHLPILAKENALRSYQSLRRVREVEGKQTIERERKRRINQVGVSVNLLELRLGPLEGA